MRDLPFTLFSGQKRPVAYVAFQPKAGSNRIFLGISELAKWNKKAMEKKTMTPPSGLGFSWNHILGDADHFYRTDDFRIDR